MSGHLYGLSGVPAAEQSYGRDTAGGGARKSSQKLQSHTSAAGFDRCHPSHYHKPHFPPSQLGFTEAASEAAKKAATNDLNGEKNKGDWVAGMHIKERPKSTFAISDPSTWFRRGGAQH